MANISHSRLVELERCEKRLKELENLKAISWVGPALGAALATQLGVTPWDKWTQGQKMTLHLVCGSAQTALELYKAALPKSDSE